MMGRLKFYYYDRNVKYNKYKKLSIEDFMDCNLEGIDYFFSSNSNTVDIETLDFNFLNEKVRFASSDVMNYQGSYYLWTYNFSYFEYLPKSVEKLLKKYGEQKTNKIIIDFLKKWFNSNNISSKPSWFPYSISKRLEYLIKTYSLIERSLGENDSNYFKYLILLHNKMLEENLETYIGYNHLLQNYKSLILTNVSSNNSRKLLKLLDIYIEQLRKEVDSDGCYVEKTPMYQLQIILDLQDILHAINRFSYNKKNIFLKYLVEMTNYLLKIEEPNGNLPMFNDTSLKYPINWKYFKPSILADVSKLKEFIRIENKIIDKKNDCYNLKESGIIILNSTDFWILSKNSSLGAKDIAGHGHADNLMLLLSLKNGKQIFVDPGIGSYEKGYYRNLFRSTMMHNTVSIERQNSSEVWSDFRVGNEAIPIFHNYNAHNGKINMIGKVELHSGEIHNRNIIIDNNLDSLKIIDKIRNIVNNPRIYVNFILHPDIQYQNSIKCVILDNTFELKYKNFDYIVIENVPYSEKWGQITTTNRISFIKDNYIENEEMETTLTKM